MSRVFSLSMAAVVLLPVFGWADHPHVQQVEFLVGDWLKSEGGDAQPDEFLLNRPFGVDFDSHANLYIVELEGGRLFQLNEQRQLRRISGDGTRSYAGDGGPLKAATFNGMHNLAIDANDIAYVADTWNHCVRRIDLQRSRITTLSGDGQAGFRGDGAMADQAQYNYVMCVSLNPQDDALFIADLKNLRIRKVDLKSGRVSTVAGNGQKGVPEDGAMAVASPLVDPRAVAVDSQDRIYILERGGHALRRISADGRITTVAGTGTKGFQDGDALRAQFASPKHLCIDDADRVIIADDANAAIRCYDPQTETVSTLLGRGFGQPRIRLSQPHGVTFHDGKLYVCDTSHNRLLMLTLAGSQ